MTANMQGVLHQHQQTALFEQMAALVRDAANLGISEQEVRDHFERELTRFYRGQQDRQKENSDDKHAGTTPGQEQFFGKE